MISHHRPFALARSALARAALPCSAALLASATLPLAAQSGEEVMRTALERYAQRMEGIENYTIVQEAMGFESTTYFEREEVDGQVVFVPRGSWGSEAGERAPKDFYSTFVQLAEGATREGGEEVDGHSCHVISITDFEGTQLEGLVPAGQQQDWKSEKLTLYLGEDDYLPYRMMMEGTANIEGRSTPVTFTVDMRDYREVDGMAHPFLMEITSDGLSGAMSPQQQEELRSALEQMREQMEDMPPEQREMVKKMMGGRFEQMEKMAASGVMDITVQVKELRVNEGPPR